jgi:hypothetical protein
VESALVGVLEHGCERDVDEASLLRRVHVEERRGEQWMGEPETARSLVDDPRGTELVHLGTAHVDHARVDAS